MNDLFNSLAADALEAVRGPDGRFVKRDVAMKFLDSVRALEGFGDHEVRAFLDRMAVNGSTRWISDWLRKNAVSAKTKKGKSVELAQYAGLRNAAGDYEQIPLAGMTLDDVRQHRDKLERTRNTYSVEITVLSGIIESLEQDRSLRTVGDAFRKLGLAA